MIVTVVGDEYEGYWISPDTDWPSFPQIDVTQKFYDRYVAYEAEREFIQSKLHSYYKEAREKELLKKCETGVPSKGF